MSSGGSRRPIGHQRQPLKTNGTSWKYCTVYEKITVIIKHDKNVITVNVCNTSTTCSEAGF
jgi:hypothetical protein